MASLQDLPNELLAQTLASLSTAELVANGSSVFRVCRAFYTLASDQLARELSLTSRSLLLFQDPAGGSLCPQKFPPADQCQRLVIDLTGFERWSRFHAAGVPYSHHLSDKYLAFDAWTEKLSQQLQFLVTDAVLPHSSQLKSLSLRANCAWLALGPFNTGRPFLSSVAVTTMLEELPQYPFVRTLTRLEIDTNDAEDTEWKAAFGVGFDCKNHVCPQIVRAIKKLPYLRHVGIRRRDLCPAMFNFSVDETPSSSTVLPNLESVVVNMRLPEQQCTAPNVYSAESRHCRCLCSCEGCDKQHIFESQATAVDKADLVSMTHFERISQAADAAVRATTSQGDLFLPNLKTFQILGYRAPYRELPNRYREPVVADCLKKQLFADVETPGFTWDWDGNAYQFLKGYKDPNEVFANMVESLRRFWINPNAVQAR